MLRRQLDAVKQQIGELKTGEAWLLLAMGRFDAAAETAEAARRETAGRTRSLSSLREVLREAALVTSAARIAQCVWVQAEKAAEGYIDLFGRDPETVRLLELARWGRGTLGPIESWREVSNPGKELAAFDPVAYASGALARLDVDGRTSAAAQEPVGEPVVPFYHGSRGRLPVDEEALRTELAAVADETGKWAWAPHIHRAWLLIALQRYEDALNAVEAARQEFYGFRGLPADRHFAEALFEDGCEAELVAHIALERWADAADAGLRGLADHLGEQRNLPLVRLVTIARGTVTDDWETWRGQFTAFDPTQYALHVFARIPTGFRARR